ncbi:PEPxxWA-CTERM sorting domain-containing protein [Sphingomonas sp. 8AM]|uniref:PEPxxWA-CTERM sorting domain-containing protein n=1 Tax=Sphingomonas sp. 8AM TaxID=2653170 RepID=UPI0012F419FC|nr:PEPxxWA-CTERM sorting domain-containing protein [Sphingomonas sp. 8AM]VXC71530.1 conserved exported hypothetical protein [Sphingomonas sp. 8AM]
MNARLAFAAIVTAASAPLPALAAVTIGTQIVDTRLTGTIAGAPLDSSASDAATGAGRVSAMAQLVERGTNGFPAVRARSSVVAELSSAERGRVTFQRSLSPGDIDSGNAVTTSSANYRYFFTTDQETMFDLDWGVGAFGDAGDGQTPGQAVSLGARGAGPSLLQLGTLGEGASGTTQLLLTPGSYEFWITDAFAPIAAAGRSSGLSGQYSFAMRAVPEPETWALMLAGFAAIGVAARRSRRRDSLPAR